MKRAEELARLANPHPNPRVGAVVLDAHGNAVGEGYHTALGRPHAEIEALTIAGELARGGTLVVTLEPCNHFGRTPPCTLAVIDAGIERVVAGAVDPDPRVGGEGISRLRSAGVAVEMGIGEGEAIDPAYFHHRRTGRPLVILKLAATLDGQTAAADGSSQWITSEASRTDAHRLRAEADAVVIGAGTLRTDDPSLDVRLPGFTGPGPRPVVVAGRRPLPTAARLWARDPMIVATDNSAHRSLGGAKYGEMLSVPPDAAGLPDLAATVGLLGEAGMLGLLVEGGPTLAGTLLRAGLVDQGILYFGSRLAGGVGRPLFDTPFPTLDAAISITIERTMPLDTDLRVDFRVHRNH